MDIDGDETISLPEFRTEYDKVTRTEIDELLRDNQAKNQEIDEQMGGFNNFEDVFSIPDEQFKIVKMETRIAMLEARNSRLQNLNANFMELNHEAEKARLNLSYERDQLLKDRDVMTEELLEFKEKIKILEIAAAHSIKKDEAENLRQDNERIQTELVETRAALMSYKNTAQVIAEQCKNLKLQQERKKDE